MYKKNIDFISRQQYSTVGRHVIFLKFCYSSSLGQRWSDQVFLTKSGTV